MKPIAKKGLVCLLLSLVAVIVLVLVRQKSATVPVNKIAASRIGKIKKVLVLSNSILKSEPEPEIGWFGNWGMAASAEDSDFYHLLIHDIHARDTSVAISSKNIGRFERSFWAYPLSNLDSFRDMDMIVLRISENVDEHKALEKNFVHYFDRLIQYLNPKGKAVVIIVDGFWKKGYRWPQPWKRGDVNEMIRNYAVRHGYPLITTTHLFDDASNTAVGKFAVKGVALHPSDKGMRLIEAAIWQYAKNYFPAR